MRQPNILWIVTTQWRAMATGYAGDANARTPWLDGLFQGDQELIGGNTGLLEHAIERP